jgi:hypothetical protein
MCVDIESYSSRDHGGQQYLQTAFPEIMAEAAAECGLERSTWKIQSTGDGELVVFPAGMPERPVVADLVPAIDRVLRLRNRFAAEDVRIRLRVALHVGQLTETPTGFAGGDVVTVCRLVDAHALHVEMERFTGANAGLIVSAEIYRSVVCQSLHGIRAERYRSVDVRVKSFADKAYVFVPDEDVNAGIRDALAGAGPDGRDAPAGVETDDRGAPEPAVPGSQPAVKVRHSGKGAAIGTVQNSGNMIIGSRNRMGTQP